MKLFFVPRDVTTKDVWLDPERLWHEQHKPNLSTTELADLVEVVTDTWLPAEASRTITFSYIDISSVDVATGRIGEVKSITADDAPARARRLVRAGDVLVSTVRPERGSVAIVPVSLDGAVASTAFVVLRPTRTSAAIVWAWLRAAEVRERLSAGATGGTFPTIRQSQLLQLPVPVHSQEDFSRLTQQVQQIINRTVSAATSDGAPVQGPSLLREFGIQMQKRKETLFWVDRSVLNVDRLDPESYVPHLAGLVDRLQQVSHPVLPLGSIATVMAGAPTRSADGEGVPILRPRNVLEGRLDLTELAQVEPMRAAVPVEAGDLLVTVAGARTGEAALVTKEAEGLLIDNNLALVRAGDRKGPQQVDPDYLVAYLNSDLGRMLVSRETSSTGTIQRLSVGGLKELPVVLPSLAEQRRIATTLNPGNVGANRDNDATRLVELSLTMARGLSQSSYQ